MDCSVSDAIGLDRSSEEISPSTGGVATVQRSSFCPRSLVEIIVSQTPSAGHHADRPAQMKKARKAEGTGFHDASFFA
jgi:hypothetical protein